MIVFGAEQALDLLARVFQRGGDGRAVIMGRGGVAEGFGEERQHGLHERGSTRVVALLSR